MNNKDAAMAYAKAGMPVFPLHTPVNIVGFPHGEGADPYVACSCGRPNCGNVGKHPRINRGVNKATTDIKQVEKWWDRWPDANIGLATGTASGIVVVDADGADAIEWVENNGANTLYSQSGNGRHYLFQHPGGRVPNSVGKLAANVDVRGDGGYIVVPPSLHRNGNYYKWFENGEIVRTGVGFPNPEKLAPTPIWLKYRGLRPVDDTQAAFEGEIPLGRRNDAMAHFAGHLRRAGLGINEIRDSLSSINKNRCKPPLPQAEIESVARSIGKKPALNVVQLTAATIPDIQLLDRDALDSLQPPQWLITNRLPEHGLSVVYGPPGAYKTFYALDMALSICTGRPYQGMQVQQGHVVYLAAEGAFGIKPRVRAWEQYNNVRAERLYIVQAPIQLNQAAHVDAFLEVIGQAIDTPKLIVIDTLARCLVGADENSALDMGEVVHYTDQIRDHIQGHVMLVHHSGKSGEYERGSTALRGAVDTMIRMQKEPDAHAVKIACVKQKDFPPFDDGASTAYRLKTVRDMDLDAGDQNHTPDGCTIDINTDSCVLVEAQEADNPDKPDDIF